MPYDSQNIFACILRGEIPCQTMGENAVALAFPDIHPQAPVHVLIIPKGAYISAEDFALHATPQEQTGFWNLVGEMIQMHRLGHLDAQPHTDTGGFRLIANAGAHGGQEVPHFHMHLLGGKPLGVMLQKA